MSHSCCCDGQRKLRKTSCSTFDVQQSESAVMPQQTELHSGWVPCGCQEQVGRWVGAMTVHNAERILNRLGGRVCSESVERVESYVYKAVNTLRRPGGFYGSESGVLGYLWLFIKVRSFLLRRVKQAELLLRSTGEF